MTHITFSSKTLARPSLEFYSDGSSEPRRVAIEKCPFKIGRAESTDLRIDSVQVSREHAEIFDRGGVWFLRDLGSTNGTQVNGKPVTEAMLADGDILKVAETELTFVASAATKFQRMVTQPIPSRTKSESPTLLPAELVAARATMETLLWQAIPIDLLTLRSLTTGESSARFAELNKDSFTDPQPGFRSSHPAGEKYRALFRRIAFEKAIDRELSQPFFLPVEDSELHDFHRLLDSVELLRDDRIDECEIGLTIATHTVAELPRMGELLQNARNRGLLIAYDQFQGNGGQVSQLEALAPDYLLLSESMIKGLNNSPDARQPLRRLESVLSACQDAAVRPVLPAGIPREGLETCRSLGYDLILERNRVAQSSERPALALV